ncbi:MAG TPA: 50S ribosomal protein L1, partial [Candidatus Nanoarchaeia archaeon]|nr:50S ribosomal protein L1 [Candidatus Nanoarchaeia archaeon]
MQKQEIKRILERVHKESPKKKFTQSIDYIVSFKDLDLKKTENQVEFFVVLNHGTGKESRICSLV